MDGALIIILLAGIFPKTQKQYNMSVRSTKTNNIIITVIFMPQFDLIKLTLKD